MPRYLLIFIGLISITVQVLLLREIAVLLNGVELIFILSLSIWLLGSTTGVYLGKRSYIPGFKKIKPTIILLMLLLIIIFFLLKSYRVITNYVFGSYLEITEQLLIITISIFPVSLLIGILYQWASKYFVIKGNSLIKAYGYECFGGIIGGMISTLVIIHNLQNSHLFLFCIVILILPLFFFNEHIKKYRRNIFIFGIIALSFFSFSTTFDYYISGWDHPFTLVEKDTPFGRINIDQNQSQLSVFNNNAAVYNSESAAPEEFIQITSLFDNEKKDCLLLTECGFTTAHELSRLGYINIVQVEASKDLVKLLSNLLKDSLHTASEIKLIISDPRIFLRNSKKYDAIYVNFGIPVSILSNRFYTKEFYGECSEHLNSRGILAFALETPENILTNIQKNQIKSIHSTLSSVFRDVIILKGINTLFIASDEKISTKMGLLNKQLGKYENENKLVNQQYLNYIFNNDRTAEINEITKRKSRIINSDLFPICFQFGNFNWLTKFFPSLININSFINVIALTWYEYAVIFACILLLFLILRKSSFVGFSVLAFSAGLIGAILEGIFIIYYQTIYGSIYQDIGLLLTVFMTGLTVGVFLYDRYASTIIEKRNILLGFSIIIINFCFLILANYVLEKTIPGKFVIFLLVFLSSALTSLLFSYSSRPVQTGNSNNVQVILGADLLGGFGGYFLVSLFLIPFMGFIQTLSLLAIFTISLLVLLKKHKLP